VKGGRRIARGLPVPALGWLQGTKLLCCAPSGALGIWRQPILPSLAVPASIILLTTRLHPWQGCLQPA
jgi:hypothetical protein